MCLALGVLEGISCTRWHLDNGTLVMTSEKLEIIMVADSVADTNSQNIVNIPEAKSDALESPFAESNNASSSSRGTNLEPKASLEKYPIIKDYKLYIKSFGLLSTLVSTIFIILKSGIDKTNRKRIIPRLFPSMHR